MMTSRPPSPPTFSQGVTLAIAEDGGSVMLTPHKGDPNVTGLQGVAGMFVIDTDTGSTYKYDIVDEVFVPSADVNQLPFPGPTPIKIASVAATQDLDRVSATVVRSILWEVSIRNGDVGAYSSNMKAMVLGGSVVSTEYAILEVGIFPTYVPTLTVTMEGNDIVLQYSGDAGMSISILRQQVEVDNG